MEIWGLIFAIVMALQLTLYIHTSYREQQQIEKARQERLDEQARQATKND